MPLEEYGTLVHHLSHHVAQFLRGQPRSKTMWAAAQ